jgi:hypothetical protein
VFKENKNHEMPELFSEKNMMPENLKRRYEHSWAKGFYEDVFCRIDESVFSVLYSEKVSRPNLPVNLYVSLEILKELFGLSDEELLDRFHFDNLFIFAMGLNRIGERTISERAFYYTRSRVVDYEERTGINLFEKVFLKLKDDYIEKFSVSQKIKRIDSTLIGSNIRRLNRLKLFLEVLSYFLKNIDKMSLLKISEEIREYKDTNVENYVYSLNSDDTKTKIQEIAEYLYRIKVLFENDPVSESEAYQILARLVDEQIDSNDKGRNINLKDHKELTSNSLQSPYDPDATYRKKGNQARQGYSVTIAETCDPDNELQLITDVITEDNNVDDSAILEDNFETLMGEETEEIIGDGAYASKNVHDKLSESEKNIITTAIRGRKPDSDKVSSTDFEIENNRILCCPNGKTPMSQEFIKGKIVAKFSHESCASCSRNCFIRKNKRKAHVLEISKEKLHMDMQREKYNDSDYLKKCKLRPAVEGTIFQIKLHLRNGKSRYRRKIMVRCSSIMRSTAINFKRVHKYRLDKAISYLFLKNIIRTRAFFAQEKFLPFLFCLK